MRHYRLIVALLLLALTVMLGMAAVTLVNGPVSNASQARSVPVIGHAGGSGLSSPLPNSGGTAPDPASSPVWL